MDGKPSILLIEDSVELVGLLRRRFEGDYTFHYALDGEGGISKAGELKPDLVLLDLTLPNMDGFEVLKVIRSTDSTRETVVIILTALSETESIVKALSMGADDYIVKPFNLLELTARIKSHLTIKDLQRQLVGVERLKTLREVAVSFNHEINNPLMAISAFAYALKKNLGESGECLTSVEGILSEVRRISDIVNKLSAAAKAATVDYSPGVKMIDVNRAQN